jgi:hypothetical protein
LTKTLLQQKKPSIKQGLPVKQKKLLIEIFISALLLLAATGTKSLQVGKANPYIHEDVSPDEYTKPSRISIFTPLNNTAYNETTTILLNIKVNLPESSTASYTYISAVYCKADWLENRVYLYQSKGIDDEITSSQFLPQRRYFQGYTILSGIPSGNHSIVVYAEGGGGYPPKGSRAYDFSIVGSSSVFFTTGIQVDTTPPRISLLSIENKTYDTNDFQLNFTVNEKISQISYVLDGQENVTITGNTILTELPNGEHNITVYATDEAGNTGASETKTFIVAQPEPEPEAEPFPTTLVAAASLATVAVVGMGLAVYLVKFKKRRSNKP